MTEKTETKPFGVGAILTITGEALMCDIGEVYQLLGWMTGEEGLMTHQLPRASRECEGFLRETFPDLAATEIPDWGETPGWADLDHAGMLERITSWLATLPGEPTREVPRLPEGDHTDRKRSTMTTAAPRLPVYIGELNDGLEPEFPTSDVPRLLPYVHIGGYQELTTRLDSQAPDHVDTIQGPVGHPSSVIGLSVDIRVASIVTDDEDAWVEVTPQNWLLVAKVDIQGCPITMVVGRRPTKQRPEQRIHWDEVFAEQVHTAKDAGRLPVGTIDANEPAPTALVAMTGLEWCAPYAQSITGILVPTRFTELVTMSLPKLQEHPPTVGVFRVPLLLDSVTA